MKKWLKIILIIFLVIILIISVGYYLLFKITVQGSLFCTTAGHASSNPSLGPNKDPNNKCCDGLVEISGDLRYDPNSEFADENGCSMMVGGGMICSNCGDDICDNWENPCNCPKDCSRE
jgi:hypothetical protein